MSCTPHVRFVGVFLTVWWSWQIKQLSIEMFTEPDLEEQPSMASSLSERDPQSQAPLLGWHVYQADSTTESSNSDPDVSVSTHRDMAPVWHEEQRATLQTRLDTALLVANWHVDFCRVSTVSSRLNFRSCV